MQYLHSKSSLFLIELMINVLFFFILLTVTFQFFTKAHLMSKKDTLLLEATVLCENTANIYQSESGNLEKISAYYPQSELSAQQLCIYYDSDFQETDKAHCTYTLALSVHTEECSAKYNEAQIRFFDSSDETIYELTSGCLTDSNMSAPGAEGEFSYAQ